MIATSEDYINVISPWLNFKILVKLTMTIASQDKQKGFAVW